MVGRYRLKLSPALILVAMVAWCGCVMRDETLHDSNRRQILGPWWFDSTDPSARYLFLADSLYEVEYDETYPYLLNGDSVAITFPSGLKSYHLHFVDTGRMIWTNGKEVISLFKWDPHDSI